MRVLPITSVCSVMISFHKEDIRFIRTRIHALTRNKQELHSSSRCLISIHWKCVILLLVVPAVLFTVKHFLRRPMDGTTTRVIILSVCAGTWALGSGFSFPCLDYLDLTMESDSTGFIMVRLAMLPALPLCLA